MVQSPKLNIFYKNKNDIKVFDFLEWNKKEFRKYINNIVKKDGYETSFLFSYRTSLIN